MRKLVVVSLLVALALFALAACAPAPTPVPPPPPTQPPAQVVAAPTTAPPPTTAPTKAPATAPPPTAAPTKAPTAVPTAVPAQPLLFLSTQNTPVEEQEKVRTVILKDFTGAKPTDFVSDAEGVIVDRILAEQKTGKVSTGVIGVL